VHELRALLMGRKTPPITAADTPVTHRKLHSLNG